MSTISCRPSTNPGTRVGDPVRHARVALVERGPSRLSARARKAIETADAVAVAAISTWEVAMLASRGRVVLDRPPLLWMTVALARDRTALLPLTAEIAARSVALAMHGDPADRLILATAEVHGLRLVTKDPALRAAALKRSIW